MKKIKVVLDTNIWVSFLISRNFDFLDSFIEDGKVKLIFSEQLLKEFISVTKRPKLKKYFTKNKIEQAISIIENFCIFQDVVSNVDLCRDSKDNFLLNLVIDSKAEFLVTGDKDFCG